MVPKLSKRITGNVQNIHHDLRCYSNVNLSYLFTAVYFRFIVSIGKFLINGPVIFCVYSAVRLNGFIAVSEGFMGIVLTGLLMTVFETVAQSDTRTIHCNEERT